MTKAKEVPVFYCDCAGCKRRVKDFDNPYTEYVVQAVEGYYFKSDTMKTWKSRLLGHTKLSNGAVVVKMSQPDYAGNREYRLIYVCKYGNVVSVEKYETSKKADRNILSDEFKVTDCLCHGCQIDRAEAHV